MPILSLKKAKAAAAVGTGVPTLRDITAELLKPGRDVRDELPQPILRTDVLEMKDLKPGMVLPGTVRNVIDFGVFVDIGVHQDGLVHVSELADRFVKAPREVVKVGDLVKVRVLDGDAARKRISLSMRTQGKGADKSAARPAHGAGSAGGHQRFVKPAKPAAKPAGAMAAAFAGLKLKR